MQFATVYDIGDQVTIDRDESLIGVIVAVMAENTCLNITYKISWFNNGSHYTAWIEEWRLNRWEG